jgi:hypothetical protein
MRPVTGKDAKERKAASWPGSMPAFQVSREGLEKIMAISYLMTARFLAP